MRETNMRITKITVYPLGHAFKGGPFVTSYGDRPTLNNLLLVMETDVGITGYGEVCRMNLRAEDPLSTAFLADLHSLLSGVIGQDPRAMASVMSALGDLPAHRSGIRAGVNGACLDIFAKSVDMPMYELLGGRRAARVPMYFTIGQAAPDAMANKAAGARARGFNVFQVKVGEGLPIDADRVQAVLAVIGTDDRLLADANGGLTPEAATQMLAAVNDPRVYWEEPCKTYGENHQLAKATGAFIVLDQCLVDLSIYAKACVSGLFAGCGLKPAIQGGVSAAQTARDLCVAHGVALKIDDNWALEAETVASLHLALGTPESLILGACDQWHYFENNLTEERSMDPQPWFEPFAGPGLGIEVRDDQLGQSVLEIR